MQNSRKKPLFNLGKLKRTENPWKLYDFWRLLRTWDLRVGSELEILLSVRFLWGFVITLLSNHPYDQGDCSSHPCARGQVLPCNPVCLHQPSCSRLISIFLLTGSCPLSPAIRPVRPACALQPPQFFPSTAGWHDKSFRPIPSLTKPMPPACDFLSISSPPHTDFCFRLPAFVTSSPQPTQILRLQPQFQCEQPISHPPPACWPLLSHRKARSFSRRIRNWDDDYCSPAQADMASRRSFPKPSFSYPPFRHRR
jgi:hypothetical protein